MKTSQLIELLRQSLQNDGDLKVAVEDSDGICFYGIQLAVATMQGATTKTLVICEREYQGN